MGKNYTARRPAAAAKAAPLALPVPVELAGLRIDQALAKMFPAWSRSRLQAWLEEGRVLVDGRRPDRSERALGGERVELALPAVGEGAQGGPHPGAQAMKLAIVHEDRDLIVINKPAGLIVHPGAGNPDRTLMNGLLAHAPALADVPRAGIVHRLDKDTSGLLVVAKSLSAQSNLAAQLAERTVKRTYLALVHGAPPPHGIVDAPVGRDARVRTRMAVTHRGREARTRYRVLERFGGDGRPAFALVECRLETGRTHQIRVHLQHLGHPVIGDPVYRRGATPGPARELGFERQALHAAELELIHPRSGKAVGWRAPLPADMKKLLAALRRASRDAA